MTLSSGDRLGPYEIRARLGAGGMGVVYRAHDGKLGRDVAIKMLSAKGAADPERLKRFEQEARAASALDHPNIITIHEIEESEDGQPYLVMQLVEGKSLRELISRRMSLAETLRIAIQIADGLARAHSRGIVHRDLKPDNVMVSDDGLVKILDFGLAKLAEPAVGSELATIDREKPQTQDGHIVGTAQYMSPEQAQGDTVDARSDIFSLGAILYEMITGRRAFHGDNAVALLADIVRRDPERLNVLDPSLPVDLDKIVHRALRKDPGRRFQHADDMRVALTELAEELESGDALTASDVRPSGHARKRWWPWAAAAALVGAAVAVAVIVIPPSEVAPMSIVPLTTDPGRENEPAISPDGTQLAFVKRGVIYVKLIGESQAVALTDGPDDASPAWSPDSARVAFLRHRSVSEHDVLEVPALGGTPRFVGRSDAQGHGISYSPDGKHMAVIHRDSPNEPGAVFLLSSETGEHRRLTSPPLDGRGDRWPKFSPDGAYIVFERVGPGPLPARTGEIRVYDLASQQESVLFDGPGWILGADWSPDGNRVVYSHGMGWDSMQLFTVPREGGEPIVLLPGERAVRMSVAYDVNRLVYIRELDDWNLWRMSGPAAAKRQAPQRVAATTRFEMGPDVSPDGKRIAYMSGQSGAWQIWVADADGSSQRQLTTGQIAAAGPRWSPDGRRIAFHAMTESAAAQIHVVDAVGGYARRLTDDTLTRLHPAWSKDGRFVYFQEEDGDEVNLGRVSAEGGPLEPVLPNASFAVPLEGGDVVFERDGAAWSLTEGETEPVRLGGVVTFRWTAWRDKILVMHLNRPVGSGGFFVDVFDRNTGSVSTLEGPVGSGNFSTPVVSPDGEWIYYQQRDTTGSDIMLVENFDP